MPPSFQPASPRDQTVAVIVMILVLSVCVVLSVAVSKFLEDDSSCAGRIMMGGQPYVCIERGDALHCYQKECDQ